MNIFFAGTPEISLPALEAVAANFEICGVLTNPDRRAGRNKVLTLSPVKQKALELGLNIFQPEVIDESFCIELKKISPDILLTFAYGKIFKKQFLDIFSKLCINIHPSLLPAYRGPSPLTAVILNGEKETGITVQKMALKMDCGDIISQSSFRLNGDETLKSLTDYTAVKSAEIIIETLKNIINNTYTFYSQDENKASWCRLVKKEDGQIDWTLPAAIIERMFRAYYPWPGIYTYLNDKTFLITECSIADNVFSDCMPGTVAEADRKKGFLVKTGSSLISIKKLKMQAGKEIDYISFLNSNKNLKGSVLGR